MSNNRFGLLSNHFIRVSICFKCGSETTPKFKRVARVQLRHASLFRVRNPLMPLFRLTSGNLHDDSIQNFRLILSVA